MGATERTVRHLRLRAGSEASVRRAAVKLEDALRCASLPDAGARVLLVRRLDLGRIAAGASSQTLSLLIEQRVAALGGAWVHGAYAAAESAGYVYFRDPLEAQCELALRLAEGKPSTAWYWPLAVPGFAPVEGAGSNLRHIALAIAASPQAPAALPGWVARLAAAGLAPALAAAIGEPEAAQLLRAARVSTDARRVRRRLSAQRPAFPGARPGEPSDPPLPDAVEPAFAALPAWLQALAIAGGYVPRLTMPRARSAHREPDTRRLGAAEPVPAKADPVRIAHAQSAPSPQERERGGVARRPDRSAEQALALRRGDSVAPAPPQAEAGGGDAFDASRDVAIAAAPPRQLIGWPYLDAAPTSAGGLLFLLAVLQRLGYADWVASLPDEAGAQIVRRMLALVLRRMQVPPDDPAWSLACVEDLAAPEPALVEKPGIRCESFARAWLKICRRWLRRVAGTGVASLVGRAATLSLSTTHVDVMFALDDADLRVRRAGLDVDLGWLPWFGRVVSFHYCRKGLA